MIVAALPVLVASIYAPNGNAVDGRLEVTGLTLTAGKSS
jgi:hypothetical protein